MFSASHPLRRSLPKTWLERLMIAILVGGAVLIRFLLDGVIMCVVGALFILSLALALGAYRGSSKLLRIVRLALWYIGPMRRKLHDLSRSKRKSFRRRGGSN